ncbi:transcription repressor OFP8-like [Benincasa hispida]|uniref:transcription repressor OFP8-like n=1 Tax=Benincasa hispida TaxID=102211 RepID=UPI0018FF16E5|nr:transcription repressor OFP8-like [Benincasa hispida]
MEKRFKLRFSRIFQSSFFSCRSKKNSDFLVTHKPISNSLISPKPPQFSSNYTPKLFPPPPSTSPIIKSPPLSHLNDCLSRHRNKSKINRKKFKTPSRPAGAPAPEGFGSAWWYGCNDETEDETETLFSSRSLTSDSSVSRRRRRRRHGHRRPERKVRDGFFAVVKNSSDPYKDFKASMAEMVVEKKIFGGKELEELLQCFISLNSRHYHKVIFEVYSEIKEALFFI